MITEKILERVNNLPENTNERIHELEQSSSENEITISSLKNKVDKLYGDNKNLNNTHIIKSYPGQYFSTIEKEKDLNNIKHNLICYTRTNDELINLPNGETGGSGILEVVQVFSNSSAVHTIQRYTNTVTNISYIRSFNKDKNTWTDWSLVSTSNVSNPNILINGSFQVWQRGTQFLSGNRYTADRWKRYDYAPGIKILKNTKGMNLQSTGASQSILITQCVDGESLGSLWGKDITISLDYKTYSGNPKIKIEIRYDSPMNNLGGSVNRESVSAYSKDGIKEGTISCTMKNLKYDYFTLIAAITVHNEEDTSDFSTIIRGVKLEIGDKATPIGEHNYSDELLKCKRYYDKCMISQSACMADSGQLYVDLHTTVYDKRVSQPTVKFVGNCYAKLQSSGTPIALSNDNIFKYFGGLEIQHSSISSGKIYTVNSNNESGNNISTPAWVEIDAEIY